MNKAEQVVAERKRVLYNRKVEKTNKLVVDVFYNFILELFCEKTKREDFTDILIFGPGTITKKEYSIHEDGLYHFDERIITFENKVDVSQFIHELQYFINIHEGFLAIIEPYKHYYNEPLTFYLQINT